MEFTFKAIDNQGNRHQGTISALSKVEAQAKLSEDGIHVIELTKVESSSGLKGIFQSKVSLEQLEYFTSQLALLLESGVRIDKGIDIIQQTNSHPALNQLLIKISASLKKGESLSEAFSKNSDVFDPLYISLLKIGEASGNLSEVLTKLAKDLSFRKELKSQLATALTYPMVIFVVCLAAVYFVLTFIVPKMSGIFTDLSQAPWYTQLIINISNFFVDYQLIIVSSIVAILLMSVQAFKQPRLREKFYNVGANTPAVGNVLNTAERIRFASSMSMMLEAGLQLDTAFKLTANTLKNKKYHREIKQALSQLKSGEQLSNVLSKTEIFPEFFLSIIKVGEETGTLPRVFNEVAERSRKDLDAVVKRLTTLLEPLMLIFMGGFVGGIVISMLMSMVAVNDVPL